MVKITFAFLSLLYGMGTESWQVFQDFDKPAFYSVMASGNVEKIDMELTLIASASFPEKEAYEGALLMKKAGLSHKPADKLRLFKTGRIKLESSLLKDSTNAEYHFLRLIIQEHAPRVVKYDSDLEKDSQVIHQTFKNLSPSVQQAILDYSKHSKILRRKDF